MVVFGKEFLLFYGNQRRGYNCRFYRNFFKKTVQNQHSYVNPNSAKTTTCCGEKNKKT